MSPGRYVRPRGRPIAGRPEFNEKISSLLAKDGFEEMHWGGNTWGYQRETTEGVISLAEEDGVSPPIRMTDPVTVTVEAKTYDAGMKVVLETLAEFYYPSLRSALESMRLF